jgi:hypothetical protein
MKRPYIALGVTQQGRTTLTLLQRMAARVIADDPHDGPPDAATGPGPLQPITETFDWGHPTLMYACIAVLAIMLLALGGCTVVRLGPPDEAPPRLWASCPPLRDVKRLDVDALLLRVAEVERWYEQCRNTALELRP